MIKNTMETINFKERVTIPPEMAKEMLTHNNQNRPVKPRAVDRLCSAIKQGLWNYDASPIRFDVNGNLADGQHRLLACVKANMPIVCDIRYNLPETAFKTIDTSFVPRGAKDIFALYRVPDSSHISALVSYYCKAAKGHNIVSKGDGHGMGFYDSHEAITPDSLYQIYIADEDIFQRCNRESVNNYKKINLSSMTIEGSFMAFLILQKHHPEEKVFDFFYQLHNVDKAKFDAIRFAYNRLVKNKTGQQPCTPQMVQATIIKAWNAYITNRDRKTLPFDSSKDEMPEWI